MFFLVVFIVFVVFCCCVWKYFYELTFHPGRLSRLHDYSSSKSLTRMGVDRFVELSFGKVHYIYHCSSSPSSTLNVFVHGYATPMEMWQNVFLGMIEDDHSCLVFDLYGRGWSDAPSVPMNVDIFVNQLAELIYALNLSEMKLNLFGVSMGGAIIQRFTELYPQRVSRLILCCSAGIQLNQPSKHLLWLLSVPIIGSMVFKYVITHQSDEKVRSEWTSPDQKYFQEYRESLRRSFRDHPGFLRSLFSTLVHFDFEGSMKSIESIQKLNLPILILWGDNDTLIPVSNAYRYHQLYHQSTLTIIPNGTHMILIEQPNEILDSVQKFFKE